MTIPIFIIVHQFSFAEVTLFFLKGVFAKNERGYKLNA